MAESLILEKAPPKIVRIYHNAKGKRAIAGSVWLEDVPGALAGAAAALANVGINLVGSSTSTVNGSGLAEWGFFAELDDEKVTLDSIRAAIRAAPHVVRSESKEGNHGVVVDSFHYPLRMSTGQPAMVISRETFSGMLAHMREVYGSGGSVIGYQLGLATGENDGNELIRMLGQRGVLENIPELTNIYLAQGWGILELVELSLEPLRARVRVSDSFECSGVRAWRPSSHFIRGHLVGFAKALFRKQVECIEVKCAASGDDVCEFECVEVPSRPESKVD